MLRFSCPKCKQVNQHPAEKAGQIVACSSCQQKMRLPSIKTKAAVKEEPALDDLEVLEEEEPASEPVEDLDEIVTPDTVEEEDDQPRKKRKSSRKEALGEQVRKFESSGFYGIGGAVLCGIIVFIGVVMTCAGFLQPPLILVGLIALILGIVGMVYCIRNIGYKVILYEGGFVENRSNKDSTVLWEDVEEVYQQITEHYTNGIYTGTTYLYTVYLDDRTSFKFGNSLKNVQKLGEAIMHETSQVIFDRLWNDYRRGDEVDFGKLSISKEGLGYGNSFLDWDDITAVKINQGYISVAKRGKWFNWCNIPVSSIPNLLVFLALVNQIIDIDN